MNSKYWNSMGGFFLHFANCGFGFGKGEGNVFLLTFILDMCCINISFANCFYKYEKKYFNIPVNGIFW